MTTVVNPKMTSQILPKNSCHKDLDKSMLKAEGFRDTHREAYIDLDTELAIRS